MRENPEQSRAAELEAQKQHELETLEEDKKAHAEHTEETLEQLRKSEVEYQEHSVEVNDLETANARIKEFYEAYQSQLDFTKTLLHEVHQLTDEKYNLMIKQRELKD